jgi:hypothetical protein
MQLHRPQGAFTLYEFSACQMETIYCRRQGDTTVTDRNILVFPDIPLAATVVLV